MAQHGRSRKATQGLVRGLVFILLVIVLFGLLWLGWALTHHRRLVPDASSLNGGSSLTVGIHGKAPTSLDLRTCGNTGDVAADRANGHASLRQALLGNVYETLVTLDEHNKPVPGLAKSWKISPDGLTYTFTLNTEMRFSNGDALDSSDVINSLKQTLNGSNPSTDVDALTGLRTVKTPNPSTVSISLNSPNPRLLYALATSSGAIYDQTGNIDFSKQALGSGPFTVRDFTPGRSITLVRNSLYWGKQPASQQITLKYFDTVQSLQNELDADHIQLGVLEPSDSPAPFQADNRLKTSLGQSTVKLVLALNNGADSIFSDQRARKSVRLIIDNATLKQDHPEADSVLGGPIGPLEPGYEDLTGLFPHDLEQGENGINYFSPSYIREVKFIAPSALSGVASDIAGQLNPTRLATSPQIMDDATFSQTLSSGSYTMALTEMSLTGDAAGYANSIYGYQNSDVQQMYQNVTLSPTATDYANNLRAYAKTVSQDSASDWLYTEHSIVAVTKGVRGYPRNMTDQRLPLTDLVL